MVLQCSSHFFNPLHLPNQPAATEAQPIKFLVDFSLTRTHLRSHDIAHTFVPPFFLLTYSYYYYYYYYSQPNSCYILVFDKSGKQNICVHATLPILLYVFFFTTNHYQPEENKTFAFTRHCPYFCTCLFFTTTPPTNQKKILIHFCV